MEIKLEEAESEFKYHTCPYHVERPGANYAGCTCSATYTSKTMRRVASAAKKYNIK